MNTTNTLRNRNLALVLVLALLASMFTFSVSAYDKAESTYFNDKDLPNDILALPSMNVNNGTPGTYTSGSYVVTIAAVTATSFTWESNSLVSYVFVKGGAVAGADKKDKNMATLFSYTNGAMFDNSSLSAPSGRGISHVTFYFGGTPVEKHGSILVSKFLEENGLTIAGPASYELTLKDGNTVVSTASIRVDDTVKFDNLVIGKTYTLTEATSNLYRLVKIEHETVTYSTNSIDIAITATDLYHTVSITNKLPAYSLSIEKLLAKDSVATSGAFGVDLYKMSTGNAPSWESIGKYSVTSGGVVSVNGPVGPGMYAVKEPSVDGYVLQKVTTDAGIGITKDGNGYYVFSIPEAVAGRDVAVKVSLTNFKAEVPVYPTYGISITKVLSSGSVTTTDPFKIDLYRLYSSNESNSSQELIPSSMPGMYRIDTAVVTPGSTVTYGVQASIGPGRYAVKEQPPTNGYNLVSVSTQGGVITVDSEGYYLFDVPEANGDNLNVLVAVTVANYKAPPSSNPPSSNPPSSNPPSSNPPSTNPPSDNPPSAVPPSLIPLQEVVPITEPFVPADVPVIEEMTEKVPQGAPALPKTGGIPLAMLISGGVLSLIAGTKMRKNKP